MQTAALSTVPRIPFGTPIVYSNPCTGFSAGDCFDGQFKNLSAEEVASLKLGTTVFIDFYPMHLNKNVRGYFKGMITYSKKEGDYVYVGFECGDGPKDILRIRIDDTHTSFFVVADEEELARTLEEVPLALIVYK